MQDRENGGHSAAAKIGQFLLGFFGGLLMLAGAFAALANARGGDAAALAATGFIIFLFLVVIGLFAGRMAYAAVGLIISLLIPLLLVGACFMALAGLT